MWRENIFLSRSEGRGPRSGRRGWSVTVRMSNFRRTSGLGSRASTTIQLPRFRHLQEHVIRVQHRDEQPRSTLRESALQDVVPQERERRMKNDARERDRASFFGPLLRRERRITIERREMMAEIPV